MGFFKPNIEKLQRRRDVQGLVRALSDRNSGIALRALEALIDLGEGPALLDAFRTQQAWDSWRFVEERCKDKLGREAVPTLLAALDSPVRISAMGRLTGLLPMPDAPLIEHAVKERLVPAVLAYAREESETTRELAVWWLAKLDDDRARAALRDCLEDPSEQVRMTAAERIGASRDTRAAAVHRLVESLNDSSLKVRRAAADALDRCRWTPTSDSTGAAYWAVRGEWDRCVEVGAAAVEPLVRELARFDDDVHEPGYRQRGAIAALDRIADPRAIEPLRQLLVGSQLQEVKDAALGTLIRLRDLRAVIWGLDASRDQHAFNLTVALLKDLGEDGLRLAEEALTERTPASPWVTEGLNALGWTPRPDALGAAYWAARGRWDRCVRIGEAAIPLLEATLAGPDLVARAAAAISLEKLNWSPPAQALGAVPYWIALGDWQRSAALGPAALPALCAMLTTTPADVTITTNPTRIEGWGSRQATRSDWPPSPGPSQAKTETYEVLRKMRIAAAEALGELRGQQAFDALSQVVRQRGQVGVIGTAVRSLARYSAAAVDTLIYALSSSHEEWDQREILKALEEISRGGDLSEFERAKVEIVVRNHVVTVHNPDLDQW